jgi:succinyl-diaminopimelate desuccinylase
VRLLAALVRIPSRGGVPAAVVCDVHGARPGPQYVLDACLDTADIGDQTAWTRPPFSAAIDGNWLHGRGSSDSKAAIAVFCHLMARLAAAPDAFAGTVTLLCDLDEHTGGFAGVRAYLDHAPLASPQA